MVMPVVSRPFEEVRDNLFAVAPPAWKLGVSQKEWGRESTEATMEWADDVEIPNSGEEG